MKQRFKLEQNLLQQYQWVIGCDEVGRGALAGPVVAAAVVFDAPAPKRWWRQVEDSKLVLPEQRSELSELIKGHALAWSVSEISHEEIDRINIHHASLAAMARAVQRVMESVGAVAVNNAESAILIDGRFTLPQFSCHQQAIINGDELVHSIAAASIVAKVHRDGLMKKLENQFPQYQFGTHKGYATPQHRKLIKTYGLSAIHRLTFCDNI